MAKLTEGLDSSGDDRRGVGDGRKRTARFGVAGWRARAAPGRLGPVGKFREPPAKAMKELERSEREQRRRIWRCGGSPGRNFGGEMRTRRGTEEELLWGVAEETQGDGRGWVLWGSSEPRASDERG